MRLHFQERPWDVYVCIGYTLLMALSLLFLDVSNVFAILLILLAPGYTLVAALFPSNKEIDWIERIILSIGLSIVLVPFLGLLLNFTPFGIRFASIVASIAVFTGAVGIGAFIRRVRLRPEDRLSATVELRPPAWESYTTVDKILVVGLGLSILVAGAAVGYVILAPRPTEPFTELFYLGPGGNASGVPAALNVSQPGTVILGVVNHERAQLNYTVRVDLVGVRFVYNATSGFNETIELNRTTWSWFNTSLGDGQNWTRWYTFSIRAPGIWMIQITLFRDPDLITLYREVHFFVRVT